jgi:hypothetical protein
MDEYSLQTVTDHAWTITSPEQTSSNFSDYAKYVAEGAYALVAVAAVLAVSLFVKRAMSKTAVTETASPKSNFVAASLDQMESSSEDSSSDQESGSEQVLEAANKRVNLSSAPKRSIDVAQMKKLIDDEDEVFKSFLNKSRK